MGGRGRIERDVPRPLLEPKKSGCPTNRRGGAIGRVIREDGWHVYPCPVKISRRSRGKFSDLCAGWGTVRTIEQVYADHGFDLPTDFEPEMGGQRRSVCAAAEHGIDLDDPAVNQRLLRVYLDGIEDWGWRGPSFDAQAASEDPLVDDARALVRSLQRDGAPIDDDSNLVLGAAAPILQVERFDRLGEPRVLLDHLTRIEAGIAADPAAAIGAAKELTESTLKFVLDDYGVAYERRANLTELYKLVAVELGLTRDAVPGAPRAVKRRIRFFRTLQLPCRAWRSCGTSWALGTVVPSRVRHWRGTDD